MVKRRLRLRSGRPRKRPRKSITWKVATKAALRVADRLKADEYLSPGLITNFGSIGNSWTEVDLLAGLSLGLGNGQRDTRRVAIKSLTIYGVMEAGDANNTLRIIIGLWNRGISGAFGTPLATSGSSMNSLITRDSEQETYRMVRKYYDKFKVLNYNGVTTTPADIANLRIFKYYKRFKKPIIIQYSGTTAILANRTLMMHAISDSAAIPNPGFSYGYIKIRYEER